MNKAELIDAVLTGKLCPELESKASAERAINAVLEGVKKGLKKDKNVQLIGFGTFAVNRRKARMGRNPATGQPMNIPAGNVIKFRAGSALKKSI